MRIDSDAAYWSTGIPVTHPDLPYPVVGRPSVVSLELSGQSVRPTYANALDFRGGAFASWGMQTVVLDQVLGEWRQADWFVRLIPQSEPGDDSLFRICWHVRLPHDAVTGLSGAEVAPAGIAERLTCGIFRKVDGANVGGFVADDVGGVVTEYRARW